MPDAASPPRRFDIALSFPGEHRDKAAAVAERLAATFGEDRILYDKYHEAEFARLGLDVHLPELYRTQSELIVLFLCPEYEAKRWCNLEWRSIRQLIARADEKRIMLLRYGYSGDFEKLGIFEGDGTADFKDRGADEIARLIEERFLINGGAPTARVDSRGGGSGEFDISRILQYVPTNLLGREAELAELADAWAKALADAPGRARVKTFVAMGGEGKTSLVAHWAARLASANWPGCETAFAWSFYSQGSSDQNAGSADLFLEEATAFFGVTEVAGKSAYERGRALAKVVAGKRALLILDGLEPLQYPPTAPTPGELKDSGLAALLKGLAQSNRGLCLVTTRVSIPDLKGFRATTAPESELKRLPLEGGVALLRALGVRGAQKEFEALVEAAKGHALTLTLIGSYLQGAHAGDIRKRDLFDLAEANAEEQRGHAFHVMGAYVKWLGQDEKGRRALAILRCLGLFDRPTEAGSLEALWRAPAIEGLTEPLVGLSEA
jgi:hypothetical protein